MLNKNNARVLAHRAICQVALEKLFLSDSLFPDDDSETSFAKSLTFGSIRFYHHLNDIITPRLKKPLEKKNLYGTELKIENELREKLQEWINR